ncbi:MAG: S-methyl-5'-thioinosine phosphorylase [Pseudomonadota bacterium]
MKIGVCVGGAPVFEAQSELVPESVEVSTDTPWGPASAVPQKWVSGVYEFYLLNRHGPEQTINPHSINYRANIWLLAQLGATQIVGTHTVGSIDLDLPVGSLVLPDQLIDYTWGRAQTFDDERRHVDFTEPYDVVLRRQLLATGVAMHDGGVYACTQGPRLETAAEVRRLAQDGCTVVGMTGMPEAVLARELEIPFASVCVVVNPAAGLEDGPLDMPALYAASHQGAHLIRDLLVALAAS